MEREISYFQKFNNFRHGQARNFHFFHKIFRGKLRRNLDILSKFQYFGSDLRYYVHGKMYLPCRDVAIINIIFETGKKLFEINPYLLKLYMKRKVSPNNYDVKIELDFTMQEPFPGKPYKFSVEHENMYLVETWRR